jgi:hypothetical protein
MFNLSLYTLFPSVTLILPSIIPLADRPFDEQHTEAILSVKNAYKVINFVVFFIILEGDQKVSVNLTIKIHVFLALILGSI